MSAICRSFEATPHTAQAGSLEPKETHNMQRYIGTKIILATAMTLGDYNAKRGFPMPEGEDPQADGYLVEYTDGGRQNHPDHAGYISWSPKTQFEGAYRKSDGLPFGHAIEALKLGKRVCRAGWNGKGMWLAMSCNGTRTVPAENFWSPHNAAHARDNGGTAVVLPSITMKTATGEILMGWLASQTDMLSDDWMILD